MKKIYDALTIAKWIINKVHPESLKLKKIIMPSSRLFLCF